MPSPQHAAQYDALLIVSFGGPEGPDDVMPFLENVLRGKNVPRERMLEVAEHYEAFGGVSPINDHVRELIAALRDELSSADINLPVYWGNRNWHPLLPGTLQEMADAGVRRSLAFFTSAYSSYSGCRQYREDVERAQQSVGTGAPQIDKLRMFFNHPGFIEPLAETVHAAWQQIPAEQREQTRFVFTAHSIPQGMADGCAYELQLRETGRLISERLGLPNWQLVYQSRSGPPQQPWLEPDVCDYLRELTAEGVTNVVISPIGFLADHLEVLYDLDTEAAQLCEELGIRMIRAASVGSHPRFISMIRELIEERLAGENAERPVLGELGPSHDVCPADCCIYTPRRPPAAGR